MLATTADASYPAPLKLEDQRRGQLDGKQRIPSLAEVRRRQQELRDTGAQLSVGYQSVLLAELNQQLKELEMLARQSGRSAALEFADHDLRIDQAGDIARRMQAQLLVAEAPLTPEELLARNPTEEGWPERTLRNRREVARGRRIARARQVVEQARALVDQRRADRAAAVRRHQELTASSATAARRLIDLYQRRIAEYVSALALHHPDGRTLYPLLTIPEIPLPRWVIETMEDQPETEDVS
ncbi:MAG: hypothetical protein ABIP57_00715 [Jatrophihabitantaceae bacterium]